MITITLDYDTDIECPSDWGGWKLISFSNRDSSYENPDNYISGITKQGEVIPANIGIRRKIDTGTAFILGCYQHSGTSWTLADEGNQCPWDSCQWAGILVWQGKVNDLPKFYEDREENARDFCKDYTNWCNGAVYYYRIEDSEGNEIDSCGGYYDDKNMFDLISEALKNVPTDEVEFDGAAKWLADYNSLTIKKDGVE